MARTFDAALSEYLYLPDTITQDWDWTFSLWFYTTVSEQTLISMGDGDSSHSFFKIRTNTSNQCRFQAVNNVGADEERIAGGSYSANTWHHVIGICNSSADIRAAIDGTMGSTGTGLSGSADTRDFITIGARKINTVDEFTTGSIAEVAVWNVELTDEEATILATGLSPLMVRPQNLYFYAPLVRDLTDRISGLQLLKARG